MYVGKIPFLRQVLLNSKVHFSLITWSLSLSHRQTLMLWWKSKLLGTPAIPRIKKALIWLGNIISGFWLEEENIFQPKLIFDSPSSNFQVAGWKILVDFFLVELTLCFPLPSFSLGPCYERNEGRSYGIVQTFPYDQRLTKQHERNRTRVCQCSYKGWSVIAPVDHFTTQVR